MDGIDPYALTHINT